MKPIFKAEQFVPTVFESAEDKAKFANQLARFVIAGFPFKSFSSSLYLNLSHCFCHIAHYDRNGFYNVWFLDAEKKASWVAYVDNYVVVGSPKHTFSDVETAFKAWLKESGHVARLKQSADDLVEARERAELKRLRAKYPDHDQLPKP